MEEYTVYRKGFIGREGLEYGVREGRVEWEYDLAVVTHLDDVSLQILRGLDSEQKEERVKASKMYSKILES